MKNSPLLLATSVAAAATVRTLSSSDDPVVDLGYAKYAGWTNSTIGITYFRGLPYAQPPVGDLRWQRPVPIEKAFTAATTKAATNQSIIDAKSIAPACIPGYPEWAYASDVQPGSWASTPQGQDEDCLVLDVLVPTTSASSSSGSSGGLPVVVQIHGGGYTTGSAQTYPGDALVHASAGGILYVSIQYRLGIYGFLAGADVAANGVQNAGLYDQRLALDWVQRHIATFGGDPAQVTIWGGSAGGGSVTYQLMAGGGGPSGTPPFRAAIAEYPWWQPLLNRSTQELQYRYALDAAGCADLNCLRGLSTEALTTVGQADLNNSYPGPGNGYGSFWFGPVVDGEFLRELPDTAFKRGNYHKVPLLVDRDGYEGAGFSNASQTTQIEETLEARNLFPSGGPGFFSRLYQLYPASDYNSTFWQRQSWFGDFIINCPTYQMATSAIDELGNSSAVFKLIFDAGSQVHGATASFLASNVLGWPNANNATLAEIMSSYWISFATTMDPNPLRSPDAPFWPSYVSGGSGTSDDGESVGFSVLDVTYGGIATADDLDARVQCEFFANRGYTLRN